MGAFSKQSKNQGQAALATVFLIGGVIILFALTLAFLALRITATTFSAEASSRALAAATAGAEDAIIKIVREPGYSGTYEFSVNSQTTTSVNITQDPFSNKVTIEASSTVGTSRRGVQVIAETSTSTGRVDVVSWENIR